MPLSTSLPAEQTDEAYHEIESALLDSARGRWFLSEHGRRSRRLDGALLEDAIARLQTSLRQPPALLDQLQTEVLALKSSVEDVRQDLVAKAGDASSGTGDNTFSTPREILKAAEDIHELAWSLQANPFDPEGCEKIARHASQLYVMSQQHGFDSSRVQKASDQLGDATKRIEGLLETVINELKVDTD